ncbi:hypothetical protein DFO73_11633 [Cytobacillus oceanisediminis]|uniref:RiboL-PSP-HEPN domain-containing protein n=1 Tax=Cytobacillus oceanisediminis TaxID=665099 RepID=A0A2V2ZJV8_9BACI|nr:hypothetical protein [Cytobacillus oceanisediminis]PWW20219.1 hypothetical protein DFO73_11633 [Cytobacillus oceanisediminis]
MHIALHTFYFQIAMEHYQKYMECLNQYNELTDNNAQWDIFSKDPEQNQSYFGLFRDKEKNAIITVVFLVMSVESLINEYGFCFLGEKKFNEFDKGNVIDKVVNIYFEATGKQFPKDKQLYQSLYDLITVRNTLVHSKSIEVDIETLMGNDIEADKQFLANINSMLGNKRNKETKQKFLDEILTSSVNVYSELITFLKQ